MYVGSDWFVYIHVHVHVQRVWVMYSGIRLVCVQTCTCTEDVANV